MQPEWSCEEERDYKTTIGIPQSEPGKGGLGSPVAPRDPTKRLEMDGWMENNNGVQSIYYRSPLSHYKQAVVGR